jgi:hypothetical protein
MKMAVVLIIVLAFESIIFAQQTMLSDISQEQTQNNSIYT